MEQKEKGGQMNQSLVHIEDAIDDMLNNLLMAEKEINSLRIRIIHIEQTLNVFFNNKKKKAK